MMRLFFIKLNFLFSSVIANKLHTLLFGLQREETEAGEGQKASWPRTLSVTSGEMQSAALVFSREPFELTGK